MSEEARGCYPRVLLVGHGAFAPRGNGGIVLCNLFDGWPRANLAVVDYATSPPALERCGPYWRLSKAAIVKGLLGFPPDARVRTGQTQERGVPPATASPGTGACRFSVHVRRPIGEAVFRLPSVVSARFNRWLAEFRPEVCFSSLGSGLMLRTVVRIADGAGIPIVPYFMDDWIETHYEGDLFERWLRSSARYWFLECLKRSPVRLAVTRDMAEEYERRYGGRFEPMEYAVPTTLEAVSRPDREAGPVRLVYTGGFAPDRARGLRAIGEALSMLAREGLRAEFSIYAPAAELAGLEGMLNMPPVMKTRDAVPYGDVQRILREADILVHAESFDPVYSKWTRYSMSTKIPEYMMAGRCIFAYGPDEITSVRYIRETGAGLVVDSADPAGLVKGLRSILADPDLRRRLGIRGREVALADHEAGRQRERFLSAIRLACGREGDSA